MHSISIYLINKSHLRNEKVDSILNDKDLNSDIKWVEMGQNILATTYIPNFEEFKKDKMVVKVETDYFGGFGSQYSSAWEFGKKVFSYSDDNPDISNYHQNPINFALWYLGVVKEEGKDEFDTIGLGRRRTNNDF